MDYSLRPDLSAIMADLRGGALLDTQIASDTGLSLSKTRSGLAELVAGGSVVTCDVLRYIQGHAVRTSLYRSSGQLQVLQRGRKPLPPR